MSSRKRKSTAEQLAHGLDVIQRLSGSMDASPLAKLTSKEIADSVEPHLPKGYGAEIRRRLEIAAELAKAAQLACLMFERKNSSNAEADWMSDDEHEAWTALRKALAKAQGETA